MIECKFRKNDPIFAFEDLLSVINAYKNGEDIQFLANNGWTDINEENEDKLDYHNWTCRGIRIKPKEI